MVRRVLVCRSFTVLLLAVVSACSGGRSTSTAAPAPATARAGTTAPAARAMMVPMLEGYALAVNHGTRTRTGQPGPHYWQQWADYTLQAELNPVSKRMSGKGTIKYANHSPDTLRTVYIQLLQNIFAPGARHDTNVPWWSRGSSSTGSRRRGPTPLPPPRRDRDRR